MFFDCVWNRADALLFLRGRLHFYHIDGTKSEINAGAPSVLVAYGQNNVAALIQSGLDGKIIHLR